LKVLYFTLSVVIADQLSKLFVKGFSIPFLHIKVSGMLLGDSFRVIGNFFRITFVENPGMAFGIGLGITTKLLISVFSILASIGLFWYLYKVKDHSFSLRFSLSLILGGAIGNLIDRVFYGVFYGYDKLFYGRVVDFFDFDFFHVAMFGRSYERFPVFNVADAAVTIGVLTLILFYKQNTTETESAVEAPVEEIQSETSSDENVSGEQKA
jgi:signal peptidase II